MSVASAIRQSLQAGGMKCSGSESSALRGHERVAARAIRNSDIVVLVLSASVSNSARVKQEVEEAVKADKTIVPFRTDFAPLSKSFEFYLSTAQWLDATRPPLDPHLEQLVTTTRRLVGLEREYTRVSIFWRGQRPSKRAVAAAVSGILSIIAFGVILGPLGAALGVMELMAIARGASSAAGRRYASVGLICGSLGAISGAAIWFAMWYYDVDPSDVWRELLGASLRAGGSAHG